MDYVTRVVGPPEADFKSINYYLGSEATEINIPYPQNNQSGIAPSPKTLLRLPPSINPAARQNMLGRQERERERERWVGGRMIHP